MLELILEDEYEVVLEPNSVNALTTIQRESPDLVLLDIWMPVISGDQILGQLRTNPATTSIPVLMYSASTEGKSIAQVAGANAFHAKPFDITQLLDSIASLLEDQSNPQPA